MSNIKCKKTKKFYIFLSLFKFIEIFRKIIFHFCADFDFLNAFATMQQKKNTIDTRKSIFIEKKVFLRQGLEHPRSGPPQERSDEEDERE